MNLWNVWACWFIFSTQFNRYDPLYCTLVYFQKHLLRLFQEKIRSGTKTNTPTFLSASTFWHSLTKAVRQWAPGQIKTVKLSDLTEAANERRLHQYVNFAAVVRDSLNMIDHQSVGLCCSLHQRWKIIWLQRQTPDAAPWSTRHRGEGAFQTAAFS